ncbi:MAG: acyl-CoA reductase [Chitinophagia bacterium]|nr:acyl-CoA reductase [Chitinophagia bacterium]
MKLEKRIDILTHLGNYLLTDSPGYAEARERAFHENKWFLPSYALGAGENIAHGMLQRDVLSAFVKKYQVQDEAKDKKVGIIMAGNIPFVGMHDLICTFLFGYKASVKLSSKDTVLFKHLIDNLCDTYPEFTDYVSISEMLKGCDAYIATGSNNSARYFEYYFGKYPHIIRKNKTSVAILEGNETSEELIALADDIQLYFGLGCRNVTQLYVPRNYDFLPLLNALRKYDHYKEHDKYKNNFDYQLTIAIMNNVYYMSNDSIVLIENPQPFSPISQLHYQYFDDKKSIQDQLDLDKIQCIVGRGFTPFGKAQTPNIDDFADGIDTMEFLQQLS